MSISAHDIRARQFTTVKRGGYDQREVEAFRTAVAEALEQAAQEATAMEARARAAVAKLKEAQAAAEAAPPAQAEPAVAVDESETISRTLLLAQRTADTTVAEAEQQATSIIESAKAESRKAGEAERVRVEGEVQALLARRDFLDSDVDQLEQFLAAQRERISAVAADLSDLTTRAADGLGVAPRPHLSASDSERTAPSDDTADGAGGEHDEEEPDVAELIEQAAQQDDEPERHDLFADETR